MSPPKMKRSIRILLTCLLGLTMILSAATAHSGTLVASEKFVERLRNGVPQEIYLTLDTTAIDREFARRRVHRRPLHEGQEIVDKACGQYAQLKKRLFASQGMKAIRLISDFQCLAMVKVQISDLAGLALLLRQPMVLKLHEPVRVTLSG